MASRGMNWEDVYENDYEEIPNVEDQNWQGEYDSAVISRELPVVDDPSQDFERDYGQISQGYSDVEEESKPSEQNLSEVRRFSGVEDRNKTVRHLDSDGTVREFAGVSYAAGAIIIDSGSGQMKSGVSGEDGPRFMTPSIVGKPRYQQVLHGYKFHDNYVGEEAQLRRGILAIKYPIVHGIITDWEDMEKLWGYTFQKQLNMDPAEHNVLLTEPPLNPRNNREKMLEIMMEKFQVSGNYIGISAVLSLYTTGYTSGLVVDSGDGVTHVVPIYEGYCLPHCVARTNLGGRDLTNYMVKLLMENGVYMTTSAEREIVRDMKEKCCYVETALETVTLNAIANANKAEYVLPDGHVVHLQNERFRCPEVIFKPALIGMEDQGLGHMVNSVIRKCDIDLRKMMYDNIILAGGNTLFENLEIRLKAEVESRSTAKVEANVIAQPDRRYSAWTGASILSMVPSFAYMWITRTEYEEEGPRVVHRKCF